MADSTYEHGSGGRLVTLPHLTGAKLLCPPQCPAFRTRREEHGCAYSRLCAVEKLQVVSTEGSHSVRHLGSTAYVTNEYFDS